MSETCFFFLFIKMTRYEKFFINQIGMNKILLIKILLIQNYSGILKVVTYQSSAPTIKGIIRLEPA